MGPKVVADLNEQGGGGRTVVGSDEVDVFEPVVGLVVAGQDDDAILLSGEAHDVVAHGQQADGGAGGEAVCLEVALGGFGFEVVLDELLGLEVVRRADPAVGGGGEILLGEVVERGMGAFWARVGSVQRRTSNGKNKRRLSFDSRFAHRSG